MEFSDCSKCNNKAFYNGECSHCGYNEFISDVLDVTVNDSNLLFVALSLIKNLKKSKNVEVTDNV